MNEHTDIQKMFPITKITNSRILSGIGDISWGYELELPDAFTLSENDYENIYKEILSVFKVLPEGSVLTQRDDIDTEAYHSKRKYNNYALEQNNRNYLGRDILTHKSYFYISFPDERIQKITSSNNSAVRLMNYLNNPYKGFPKTEASANELEKLITSELKGISKINVRLMNTIELTNEVFNHWTFDQYKQGKKLSPVIKDEGKLKVGDTYVGVISIVNHGRVVQYCKKHQTLAKTEFTNVKTEDGIALELGSMFQAVFGLPYKHSVTRTFIIKEQTKNALNFLLRSMGEGTLARLGVGDAGKRMKDLSGFNSEISEREYTIVDMSCTLIVPCQTLSEYDTKTKQAKTVLKNINDAVSYIEPYQEALPIWVGCTPGYTRANYRTYTTVMEHALTYFTYESPSKGSYEGHLFADRFGSPILIDLWKNKYITGPHGLVEGNTGTGKSFYINNMIDQDLEQGTHVMVLDVSPSYKDICTFNNGIYYDSSDIRKMSFPVFMCPINSDGKYIPDDDKTLFLQSILVAIWKGNESCSNEEHAIIMDIIGKYYEYLNSTQRAEDEIPCMTSFYHFFLDKYHLNEERKGIFNKEGFLATMEQFVFGKYKHLLNGKESIDLTYEKFIVFDIKTISNDTFAFPVIALIIMEMLMEKIRNLEGIRKRFIIDEGWSILQSHLSKFVEYLYRTFRKADGSIYLATQRITDLYDKVGENMAKTLISNADTIILMRRYRDKNYPDLQKWLSITNFEVDMLKDAKKRDEQGYREFMIKQGDRSMLLRLESHKKTIALYGSEGDKKKRIKKHIEETNNIEFALNQYTEDNIKINYLEKLHQEGIITISTLEQERQKLTLL